MQLLEQAEIVSRVLGRVVAGRDVGCRCGDVVCSGGRGWRTPNWLRPDLVRVDAGALQSLAVLLDAEAALGEAVGVLPPERPLLDEAPVDHDEPDGHEKAREPGPRRVLRSPPIASTIPVPAAQPTSPIANVSHAASDRARATQSAPARP